MTRRDEQTVSAAVVRVRGGVLASAADNDTLAVEAPLEIRFGPKRSTVLMRTPGADEELVTGFLFTEGLIGSAGEIESMERPPGLSGDELGNVLSARLAPGAAGAAAAPERAFVTSSACGVCGKERIAQLVVRSPRRSSTLRVKAALAAGLPARLRAAQPAFTATGGLHAAGLFDASGALVCAREDVGRHNAVDKVIGWAVAREATPLVDHVLVVSGRAGYEILQKAIAAGVPVIVAVGAPSSLAVELAEEFDVTLVGFARDGACNVYAGAERVG
jgi:FdhD protein